MENTLRGVLGYKGERGYSAYEVAVRNGYIGTEEDWLAELGTSTRFNRGETVYFANEKQSIFDLPFNYTSNSILDVYIEGRKLNSDEYVIDTTTKKIKLAGFALDKGTVVEVVLTNLINHSSDNSSSEGSGGLGEFNVEVVEELPTDNINMHTIYFIRKNSEVSQDVYDEYMFVNEKWEHIGNTQIDLSSKLDVSAKATTEEAQEGLNDNKYMTPLKTKEAIKEDKNVITGYLSNNLSLEAGITSERIPLEMTITAGDKLTLNDENQIVIGVGISRVLISGQICMQNNNTTSNAVYNLYIYKNGSIVMRSRGVVSVGNLVAISQPAFLLNVEEGDTIHMGVWKTENYLATLSGAQNSTFLTVEAVG